MASLPTNDLTNLPVWKKEKSSSDDSSYSLGDSPSEDESLEVDNNQEEPTCVSDMQGNRMLSITKLVKAVTENMCCQKCAVNQCQNETCDFKNIVMRPKKCEADLSSWTFYSWT